ncbi:MAG: VOC family protein [Halobacteriales archaeon]|nr:VOC family protein [Halobacteriales archaeon]
MQLAELTRFVDDVEAAVAFYRTVLDAEPVSEWPGGAVFDLGGPTLLVHETYEPGPDDLPPVDHVSFAVDDVDAAADQLADPGLELEREPAEYDWGRSAYLRDPAGNQVELMEA